MPTQITRNGLIAAIAPEGFIQDGSPDCIEGIKYDFRFGGKFLKAKHRKFLDLSKFQEDNIIDTKVDPGETVFVITLEELRLPVDIKAELSLKRKLAHEGILILGGFCVDPGYEGPLIFGLYNFSSVPFLLQYKKKLVAAQFYRLTQEELCEISKSVSANDLMDSVTRLIANFSGVSNQALTLQVSELESKVKALRDELKEHDEWYNRFSGLLDKIGNNLDREMLERKMGQDDLTKLLQRQELRTSTLESEVSGHRSLKTFLYWIAGICVILLSGLLVGVMLLLIENWKK